MFIGGLNWDTTDGRYFLLLISIWLLNLHSVESLRDYFTQFGKVDACTIMRDAAGRSRCFAFLTFDDPASVNAVMVREHMLDGKIVRPSPLLFKPATHVLPRLTLSVQSPGKSTREPLSSSLVASLAVSHLSP